MSETPSADWIEPDRWPSLAPDELHLWFVTLDVDAKRRTELTASLSETERSRAARFVFDKHRMRYAVGRGLLRELLGRYLNTPPARLEFEIGALGKPYLRHDGWPRLQFNYSDAGGMALFGCALEAELGVDLESLAREVRHREIAQRHFHAAELDALRHADETRERAAFLACWTRKEAWGKARGVGIRYPLNGVDVCSELARETLTLAGTAGAPPWRLVQLHPAPGYIGAVAYAGEERRLRCFVYPKWQT